MRAVVTVTGTDRRGVIAQVSNFLARRNVNIEDVSQTVLGEQFAMIMVVDLSEYEGELLGLASECADFGKEIGMAIRLQHTEIFDAMHTV